MKYSSKLHIFIIIFFILAIQDVFAPIFTRDEEKAFKELIRKNRKILYLLSEPQRRVLEELYIEGKNREQVADTLGVAPSTISGLKLRGLAEFKKFLDPESDYSLVSANTELLTYLPVMQRDVLVKHFIDGKSNLEISNEMKIPTWTVICNKQTGLKKLRMLLLQGSDANVVVRNRRLLRLLPDKQRIVLEEYYIHGKKFVKIADDFGTSRADISYNKRVGLAKLRHFCNVFTND